jgi:hypothetical protein
MCLEVAREGVLQLFICNMRKSSREQKKRVADKNKVKERRRNW